MAHDDPARIEASIRSAALAAARGVPIGEAFLSKIVAETSQPGLSLAERVTRATVMAEQYAASPKPLNVHSATPQDIATQAKTAAVFGSRLAGGSPPNISEARRESAKANYQTLGNSDPRSMQTISVTSFASSPFVVAGLDFATFSYLRGYDRTFTAQNILNAANDTAALGFSPKDRAAMLDHAIIDRHDPKARATNKALQDYQKGLEGDEELAALHDRRKRAATAEDRKAIDAEITSRRNKFESDSGLRDRLDDKQVSAKANAAIRRRKSAIEKRLEQNYDSRADVKVEQAKPKLKSSKPDENLFKKLTASPK
ncbi:hypothetical protein [uncultured Bradyrhizobium sp.]|uniref:hypothetical protein n=1 Tax=uncultured Bradyrhizobium sp. TaxID=199684 RepID=UPI0035CBC3B9